MRRSLHAESLPLPGFQIAPMIDVVFVIMLFFMVMAGLTRKEGELAMKLPNGIAWADKEHFPHEELLLDVLTDGTVMLNEEVFDTPASRELPGMSRTLRRIQQTVTAQHSKVLATVRAEPEAGFQRVMDVMDALNRAGIANVTFEVPGH